MFKNLINMLKKPQLSFLRIKDKTRKSLLYILLLTIIMTIPVFILAGLNKKELILEQNRLREVASVYANTSLEIRDGKLYNPNNINDITYVNNIYISIGERELNLPAYIIMFDEEKIVTYMTANTNMKITITEYSYSELGYENFIFFNNENQIVTLINKTVINDSSLLWFKIFESFFNNFFDLIFVILLLSLIAKIFTKLPINFKGHFNINTYVATSYAITFLILDLFNIGDLNIIALIVTYFYQMIAYRSVRIIPNIKVGKKDE